MLLNRWMLRSGGFAVVAVVAVMLAGCSGVPKEARRAAVYEPIPDTYKETIVDLLGYQQVDYIHNYGPEYIFKEPYKAAFRKNGTEEWSFGYAVKARVNTKVRYGGYLARAPVTFFFDRGRGRRVRPGDTLKRMR